jgi:hypothetical protein
MIHLWKNFAVALLVTLLVIGGLAWFVSRLLVTPPPKRIMTSAFQMDLAEGWSCYQEGTTWTCEPGEPGEQKAVVAVFAMKYRGPEDTPKAYAEYLRTPKSLTTRDGGTQLSTVKYVKVSRIGGYDWTDALHLGPRSAAITRTISRRSRHTCPSSFPSRPTKTISTNIIPSSNK